MSDREKLIELLIAADEAGCACIDDICMQCDDMDTVRVMAMGYIADHLIANGVTVQKHGRWLDNAIAFAEKCSICGKGVYWDDGNYHRYTYCPNCGAKMDGEINDL